MQKSGHIDDGVQISALDAIYGEDGRRSRCIGEVLEWYRGEDAGNSKRIELVENWTCLNVLEKKICKLNSKILMEEKSWRAWKRDQNFVMDEELVQNFVMDEELVQNFVMDEELVQNVAMSEKFVKNFVMDAKIDPKVEMDLPIFKISGWNILQHSKRKLMEESIEEDEL